MTAAQPSNASDVAVPNESRVLVTTPDSHAAFDRTMPTTSKSWLSSRRLNARPTKPLAPVIATRVPFIGASEKPQPLGRGGKETVLQLSRCRKHRKLNV